MGTETSDDSIKLGIYNDDGTAFPGYPEDLIGETDYYVANTGAPGWIGYPLQSSVNITAGEIYYLTFQGNGISWYYDTGEVGYRYSTSHTFIEAWDDPFPHSIPPSNTSRARIYAIIKEN